MDITDVETAEYLESRLEEHSASIERISRNAEIQCARSYYLMSHSEEPLRKIKPSIPAESFDYLNVVRFERDVIYENHDSMYIITIITFGNGNIYSYRNDFSYNPINSLAKLKKEKEVDFLALDLFDTQALREIDESYNEKWYNDIELRGGIGNRVIYSSANEALKKQDYRSYSPTKELKDLADPNRSIRGDLKVYSKWIKELEKSNPIPKTRKLSFLFDSSIKEYMTKKGILFLMRFFDGDKYIKLANRLEGMLELKKEGDDDNVFQKETKDSDKID